MPLPRLRAHSTGSLALLLAIIAGVLFLRRPDAFLRPQFWAEDFTFLIAAEQHGLASLGMPQAGYLHTLPRLIALAATALDPLLQPTLFLLASLGVTLGVCGSLCSPRLELPNIFFLALAIVAVPHTGEVFFNPTNLQWIVALGILGTVLKQDPRDASDWCADLGFIVLGGLTGPMILFAWPLWLVRAWQRRSRASLIFLLAGTGVAAIQLSFVVGLAPESTEPFHLFNLGGSVAYHLFCRTFFGALVTPAWSKIAAIAAGALLAGLIGAVIVQTHRYRAALIAMVFFATTLFAATVTQKRIDAWPYGELHGDRYFYISNVILLWILVIGAAAATQRWQRQGAIALLALAIVCNVPRFQFAPHPDLGWYDACPRIRAGERVVVTIHPNWKFLYQRGTAVSRQLSRREEAELRQK